jgi:diguanylate cyclase (GGDEF)-like protein
MSAMGLNGSRIGTPMGQLAPEAAERLQEEQIAFVLRYTPGTMIATVCNGIVCMLALWQTVGAKPAVLWGLSLCVAVAPTGWRRLWRQRPGERRSTPRQLIRKAILNAFLLGTCWAAVPYFFFDVAYPELQLIIACLSAGMLSGGFFALASIPGAAVAYGAPLVIGFFLGLERLPGHSGLLTEVLVVSYVSVLLVGMALSYAQLKARVLRQIAMEHEVRRDPVTGLPNRVGLRERLDARLAHSSALGVIAMEIGGLWSALEHRDAETERALLLLVANRLRSLLDPKDLLARMGEDRLTIVSWRAADEAAAKRLSERIVAAFASPFELSDRLCYLTVTLGIAFAPRDGSDSITIVRNSDIALHEAKREAGRVCVFFQPQLDARVLEHRELSHDLRAAIEGEALTLVFQPIQHVESGRILGCEALVRWVHPRRGQITPGEFIPLAEESGLIHDLGLFVLRQAVRTARNWPADVHVSVNVSPVQLESRDFPEQLLDILVSERFPPHRLVVEITETALFRDAQLAMGAIQQINQFGVALSLDDFGTGYSSLNYIRHTPLSYIKIDKSFVNDLLSDEGCAAIVRGLIRMAQDLGVSTVAEGVETEAQLAWLKANGCTCVQGFLISRPMAESKMAQFFRAPGSAKADATT